MYYHTAYALRIKSELFFPELINTHDSNGLHEADVTISFGHVPPEGLSDLKSGGLYYHVKPNAFWLHVPDVAHFLVTNGDNIMIQPAVGIDDDSLRAFLLTSCFAALLMQRNLFVLQGAVVASGGDGIALIGASGAGKSRIAAALLKKGYSLLADDICALNMELNAIPGIPQMNVWLNRSLLHRIKAFGLKKIRPGIKKYVTTQQHAFHATPLFVKKLLILNPSKHHHKIQASALSGGNKINYLQKYIYNNTYVTGFEKDALYFNYVAKLAIETDVILIEWPIKRCRVHDVVRLIVKIQEDGDVI